MRDKGKILILGCGKSGTTGLLFKVAGGIPNCHAFLEKNRINKIILRFFRE